MSSNVELKARYDDLDAGHRVAQQFGAVHHGTERQRDTYFRAADGRLKLRERWSCDPSGANEQSLASQLISYRRSDVAQSRSSDYLLVVVENGAELRDLLATSLGVIAVVEKLRTIYLHDNVRIHLDDVAGLGFFLEFEAIVDATCDESAAHAKLEQLCRRFGVASAQILSQSYSDFGADSGDRDQTPPPPKKHPPRIELSTLLVVIALCAAVFGLFKLLGPAGLCFAAVPATMVVALIRTCWE